MNGNQFNHDPEKNSTQQNLNHEEQFTSEENHHANGTENLYGSRDEETAAELSAVRDANEHVSEEKDEDFDIEVNNTVGWVAIALSVISFFWLPILFGAAGIITGFIARSRNANVLGNIAIAAGVIAILMSLFIRPFY